jgi:hypothetical protein
LPSQDTAAEKTAEAAAAAAQKEEAVALKSRLCNGCGKEFIAFFGKKDPPFFTFPTPFFTSWLVPDFGNGFVKGLTTNMNRFYYIYSHASRENREGRREKLLFSSFWSATTFR